MSGIISDEALLAIERARSTVVSWLRRIGYNISINAEWDDITEIVSEQKNNLIARHLLDKTIDEYVDTEITNLGSYAFYYCSSLRKIELPNLLSIGSQAFNGLSNLQYPFVLTITSNVLNGIMGMSSAVPIIIKNGLVNWLAGKTNVKGILDYQGQSVSNVSIPSDAFSGYAGKTIIIRDENRVASLGSASYIPIGVEEIYVPHDLVNSYKQATNWSAIESKIKDLQGSDYESLTWYENWTPNE